MAHICSHFFNTINLDLGGGSTSLSSVPPEDIFFARYSQFDIQDFSLLSVQESGSHTGSLVFPNPTHSFLHLRYKVASIKKVSLWNTTGQMVLTIDHFDGHPVDLSMLPAGLYVIRMDTRDGLFAERILKQ